MLWKSVTKDIQDMMTCAQQLGMAQEFYFENIKLLLEVVIKHFLYDSKYAFQENDLELRAYISKALKTLIVPINKEPYWVLQNWEDIMAFMMYRRHLVSQVHTAGDILDSVQQGIGSYTQTSQHKSNRSRSEAKTSSKTTFTTEAAIKQGTLSEKQELDDDLGDKNTREERNNQQEQHKGRNDCDDSESDSSNTSRSSSTWLVKCMLRPRTNNHRGQFAMSVEQEKWESTTGASISPGQKKLSKQLKGIEIAAPENLQRSGRK